MCFTCFCFLHSVFSLKHAHTKINQILQQKGTFETGQEDSTEVPEELKLRLAYREAAVAVLACYIPDPYRPFADVCYLFSMHSLVMPLSF